MRSSSEAFRISLWWMTLYVVVASTSIAVPLALVLVDLLGYSAPTRVLAMAIAGAVGCGEIFSFLAVLIFVLWFKVYVDPAGLRAHNFWGAYRECPWADIQSASPFNFIGLRYLRARTSDGKAPLWLPLFLADREGFYRRIREYAGPNHPLAVALHQEMS
jgi:hypothetical protein